MEYRYLGNSNLKVSRLCFGTLTMGPLQAALPVKQGARLINRALEGGVNFIDTAELYDTYPHIEQALRHYRDREKVVIATKTYAYTARKAAFSLEKARQELNRDVIEVFLLHEQESRLTLEGHRAALEYLLDAREKGLVRLVGISTHTVAAAVALLEYPEAGVVHPMFNIKGLGIKDGTREEMLAVIRQARSSGVGVYTMKALAGGHLMNQVQEALTYQLDIPEIDAVALGLVSEAEVEYALHVFSGREIPAGMVQRINKKEREIKHLGADCTGCRKCMKTCPQDAVTWENGPVFHRESCVFCGYCGASCPSFCLRIY